jgi:NADPH2:quinone reductase
MMVMYGSTSGLVPAFVPKTLDYKGALFMTWASMAHYTATREEFVGCARDPMVWMVDGRLKVHIDRTLPLAQAAEAHRALADRGTIGKILLAP